MTATLSKNLNIVLWVLQVLLAAIFLRTGFVRLFTPIAELSSTVGWATAIPELLVRFIGLAETVGALGLLLPSLTKIQPALTPLAALGLTIVMLLALLFHTTRGEFNENTLIFGALSALVAWGRRKVPIQARG
jgi:putative oxidoreductase